MSDKEKEVTVFCTSIQKGISYENIKSKAISIGEKRHRVMGNDFIIVGYTGNPPFPKKLCRVDFVDGKVSETHRYGSK